MIIEIDQKLIFLSYGALIIVSILSNYFGLKPNPMSV